MLSASARALLQLRPATSASTHTTTIPQITVTTPTQQTTPMSASATGTGG